MTTLQTFDRVDSELLAEIQKQFPLDHRPFEILGEKLGISEQECLERVARLKTQRVIRQLSAIFDARTLGYRSTLVAMQVEPLRVDDAAETVNRYPGVSRNNQRNDLFNLWFTVATPPTDSLEQVVTILQTLAKADETILLPMLRRYTASGSPDDFNDQGMLFYDVEDIKDIKYRMTSQPTLTERDLRFIRVMQEDLPLLEIPYAVWAEQVEATEEEFFTWTQNMRHRGHMQRVAAVLSPQTEGFSASATVVWQVPQEQVDTIGAETTRFREVSHACRRPSCVSWPYSLFTTIHAKTPTACMDVVKRVEERIGQFPHRHLVDTKTYKATRLRYFPPELENWWDEVGRRTQ